MSLQSFTRNYEDNSTEEGFQFTFYCDLCNDGYKSQFVPSTTYKKAGLLRGLSRGISIGASLIGAHNVGYNVERGSDILSERFEGMSPEWHKEHETAFKTAINEAKGHFHRCENCRQWVCDSDFNEEEGLCTECAPRMNVKVAAARSRRMVDEIDEQADKAHVFTGEIEKKQITCPSCGKPTSEGKFCTNCGASIALNQCPRCGAKLQAGVRFCGECGNKM
jgi:hypothetical protein